MCLPKCSVTVTDFLLQLERQNVAAAQTLRKALSNAELNHPGITYDLVLGLVRRADLNVDMNESVLRLQGVASDCDGMFFSYLLRNVVTFIYLFVLIWILWF